MYFGFWFLPVFRSRSSRFEVWYGVLVLLECFLVGFLVLRGEPFIKFSVFAMFSTLRSRYNLIISLISFFVV